MHKFQYSEEIADRINTFLTVDEWNYRFDEDLGCFFFDLSMKGKIKKVSYIIDVRENHFVVYAVSPLGVDREDKKTMDEMAKFISYANYSIRNGSFEIDHKDGEIRYKVFVDCDGIMPSSNVIYNSVYIPAASYSHFSAGIADIIFCGATAEDAYAKTEEKLERNEMNAEGKDSLQDDPADTADGKEEGSQDAPSDQAYDEMLAELVADLRERIDREGLDAIDEDDPEDPDDSADADASNTDHAEGTDVMDIQMDPFAADSGADTDQRKGKDTDQ